MSRARALCQDRHAPAAPKVETRTSAIAFNMQALLLMAFPIYIRSAVLTSSFESMLTPVQRLRMGRCADTHS